MGMVSNGYSQPNISNVTSILKDEPPKTTHDVMNIFEQSIHSLIIVGAMQDNIFLIFKLFVFSFISKNKSSTNIFNYYHIRIIFKDIQMYDNL